MTTSTRKEQLIKKLQEEVETMPKYNFFGEENDPMEHTLAIAYLQTGELPDDWEDMHLVYGVVEDFDMICSDYDIEATTP